MINTKLLANLCEEAGAPGYEGRIRKIVLEEIKPYVDEINIDNMGNVIAIKKGKERKKVMIGAHMDEIGFIVTHIDEKGFVYFHTLGGFDPKTLTAQCNWFKWIDNSFFGRNDIRCKRNAKE